MYANSIAYMIFWAGEKIMKLEYLKLENFALIEAGMKLNTLELDFRNSTNTVTLITGNNGTGKTGLLSNIHPFATLGHLEARDDMDLIIPGKNGKKTCVFSTKKHEYYIEHHYTWVGENRSRTIKSYIQKDGVELNESGLGGKFLEIVQREFEIDINFLKLIRLGSNVTNFVELTASGRISFISRLLSAIERYNKANKLIRERANELNANLKAETKKKAQLNISDVAVLKEEISRKQTLLTKLKKDRDDIIAEFYSYSGKMHLEGMDTCENNMKEVVEQIASIKDSIKRLKRPVNVHIKMGDKEPDEYYSEMIEENSKRNQLIMEELSKALAERNVLDDKISKLQQLEEGLISEIQLKNIKENIASLKKKVSEYERLHDVNNAPSLTTAELTADVDKINMIYFHFHNIMQLNSDSVKYFCDKYEEYSGDLNMIDEYARDRLITLHRKLDAMKQAQTYKTIRNRNPVMFVPSKCTEFRKCPFYNAYNDIDAKNEGNLLNAYETELAAIEDLSGIISSVYSIKKILAMRNQNIKEYSISLDDVLRAIRLSDISQIVDDKRIRDVRDTLALYDDYSRDLEELKSRESELKYITAANESKTKESVKKELGELFEIGGTLDHHINDLYTERNELNEMSDFWHEMIDDYLNGMKYQVNRAQLETKLVSAESEKEKLIKLIEYKRDFDIVKSKYDGKLKDINDRIESVEKDIQHDHYRESMYISITEEIERIKKRFDYVNDIKDATSQNGGIPLVHIKLYCRALCTIANNIIKDLYTGDFYLKEFDVREGVFNIPYYTKGFKVKDIRNGSQAEVSVAKLAISFAILSQFMTKYNIVLLDEIDGPMHRVNKERFFSALEGQLERLHCEQAFIITQSAMFNDYPVNLIVTDPDYKNNLPDNAKIIFQR